MVMSRPLGIKFRSRKGRFVPFQKAFQQGQRLNKGFSLTGSFAHLEGSVLPHHLMLHHLTFHAVIDSQSKKK